MPDEYLDRLRAACWRSTAAHGGAAQDFAFTHAGRQISRRRHGLRRRDPGRRPEDAAPAASTACAARSGVAAGPDRSTRPNSCIRAWRRCSARCRAAWRLALEARPGLDAPCSTAGQPRPARAHRHGLLVPGALLRRGPASGSGAARCATRARGPISSAWLGARRRHGAARLRSRGRGAGLPPARQGLFRHPRARRVEVRQGLGEVPLLTGGRRRGLAAAAEGGRAGRREGHGARRRAEDRGQRLYLSPGKQRRFER